MGQGFGYQIITVTKIASPPHSFLPTCFCWIPAHKCPFSPLLDGKQSPHVLAGTYGRVWLKLIGYEGEILTCSFLFTSEKKKGRKTRAVRIEWKSESVLMLRCEADRVRDSMLAMPSCQGTCPLPVQRWQAGHWEWVWWQLPPPSVLCHDTSSQVRQSLQTARQHVSSSRSTEQLADFKCGVATARGISVFVAPKALSRV